jgi:hypothetical protein
MESIGIPSTRTHAYWTLLPSPTALDCGHSGGRRARRHLEPLGMVTGRSCGRDYMHLRNGHLCVAASINQK